MNKISKLLNSNAKPLIMGVLNLTPDSFSDGGKYNEIDLALKRVEYMIESGADIIDIGAESSRPGAEIISVNDERDSPSALLNENLPAINLVDLFNEEKVLSNFDLKEKFILINFFASWCAPCKVEHPIFFTIKKNFLTYI